MIKYLFLDIDNTLIYKKSVSDSIQINGEEKFIHKKTQDILENIKKIIPVILISGRRKINYFKVKKFIPHDIAILEHGGLIYNDKLIFSKWKKMLAPTCYQKKALLWKFANELEKRGFYIDKTSRIASFRVQLTEFQKILPSHLKKELRNSLPSYLDIVENEEMIDVIPKKSGKLNAASFYLQERKIDIEDILFIGNGENDIGLLSAAGKAITFRDAPSKVILSVKNKGKDGFIIDKGHLGIIKALQKIKKELIN